MIGNAMKDNPGFVDLRRIETAKEISNLLSRSQNRMVLNSESLLLSLMGGRPKVTGRKGVPTAAPAPEMLLVAGAEDTRKRRGWLSWVSWMWGGR